MTEHSIDGKHHIDLRGAAISGRILDIGGGGEGMISRQFGDVVVAIDKRKDELEESPDIGLKIIMDACDMQFLDKTFDNATCFYSLMYMSKSDAEKCLKEAYRVLKPGGGLWIWDAIMPYPAKSDIFLAPLAVTFGKDEYLTPTYGISWHKEQTAESTAELCANIGFDISEIITYDQNFFLKVKKS